VVLEEVPALYDAAGLASALLLLLLALAVLCDLDDVRRVLRGPDKVRTERVLDDVERVGIAEGVLRRQYYLGRIFVSGCVP